ncbi:hypothetical protein ACNKHT_14595 [Shigella flexneri]
MPDRHQCRAYRALGSPIRGGEAFNTGCIPFDKHFQTAVNPALRAACAAVRQRVLPMWHLEVESRWC